MIIDIAEDKIVVDEFCDAIVAGIASSGDNIEKTEGSEIGCVKGNILAGIAVVGAAEKAIERQKREFVRNFMKKASPEDIAAALNFSEDEE
jgi:hypothetical protein